MYVVCPIHNLGESKSFEIIATACIVKDRSKIEQFKARSHGTMWNCLVILFILFYGDEYTHLIFFLLGRKLWYLISVF